MSFQKNAKLGREPNAETSISCKRQAHRGHVKVSSAGLGPCCQTALHLLVWLLPGFRPPMRLFHSTGPVFSCTQLTLKKRSVRSSNSLSWQLAETNGPCWAGSRRTSQGGRGSQPATHRLLPRGQEHFAPASERMCSRPEAGKSGKGDI